MRVALIAQRIWWLSLLLLAACRSSTASNALDDDTPAGPPPVSFESLKQIVQTKNLRSIDALLQVLPSIYPDLAVHYALLYRTRSPQAASSAQPRVIAATSDGRFVMAFNGVGKPGQKNLEIIQWDDDKKVFDTYRIMFPEANANASWTFYPKDPEECADCHQTPLRPNWEPFQFWPGAFGERDGSLATGSTEESYLHAFVSGATSLPRYRYLPDLATKFAVNAPDNKYGAPFLKELTAALAKLNAQRVAKELMATPRYAEIKYFLAAVMYNCGYDDDSVLPQYYPGGTFPGGVATSLKSFVPTMHDQSVYDRSYTGHYLDYLDKKLDLKTGINLENWSMAFDWTQISRFRATTPFNDGTTGLNVFAYEGLAVLDPDLQFLRNHGTEAELTPNVTYTGMGSLAYKDLPDDWTLQMQYDNAAVCQEILSRRP